MSRNVKINISAKDKSKAAFNSVLHNLANFVHVARAGIDIMKKFGSALLSGIKTAMGWQAAARPFARFVGSIEEAEAHVKSLQDIGAAGVIDGEKLVEASRSLMQLSGGLVGGVADMKALADVSATTGEDINKVSVAVGNFMQRLQAGDDITRAIRDLEGMGVISNETALEMRNLAGDAENAGDIFDLLTGEVNKFAGGVEDDMNTAEASVNRAKDQWRMALGEAGGAFLDLSSNKIGGLADKLQDLRDSGIIEEWAERAVESIEWISEKLSDLLGWISRATDGIRNMAARVGATIGGMQAGMSLGDAFEMSGDVAKQMSNERSIARNRRAAARDERRKAAQEERNDETGAGFAADEKKRAEIVAVAKSEAERKAAEKIAKDKDKLERDAFRKRLRDEILDREKAEQYLISKASMLRERALATGNERKKMRDEARAQEREERRFDSLVRRALLAESDPNRKASNRAQDALASLRAEEEAKREAAKRDELQKKVDEATIKSEKHLEKVAESTGEMVSKLSRE